MRGTRTRKETQKDRFAKALIRIKPDVTEDDRKELMSSTGLTFTTVSRYLNGKVHDLDTAASILRFLRDKIQQREELINC